MLRILIKNFDNRDYSDLAKVFLMTFKEEGFDSNDINTYSYQFKAQIENDLTEFIIAENEQEIIGLGATIYYEGCSYIGYLGVLPNYRQKGIGTEIFRKLTELAYHKNKTVELMANYEAVNLYHRFKFVDEYLCKKCVFKSNSRDIDSYIMELKDIPKWIYQLDQDSLGFSRRKLLDYLLYNQNFTLIARKNEGFAFFNENMIGPVISKNSELAVSFIDYSLLKNNSKEIIIPSSKEDLFREYIEDIKQSCLRMRNGKKISEKEQLIFGFHSYATS